MNTPSYSQHPPVPAMMLRPPMPDTHLLASILVTLFCCMPFGVVAIVKSVQAESLYYKGLYDEARRAADDAARWGIRGFLSIMIPAGICAMGTLMMLLLQG